MEQQRHRQKPKQFDDDQGVIMTWFCAICRETWKSPISKGELRSMPSYVKVRGRRIQTRRPDGSMLRAHPSCAEKLLNEMAKEEEKKSIIIAP